MGASHGKNLPECASWVFPSRPPSRSQAMSRVARRRRELRNDTLQRPSTCLYRQASMKQRFLPSKVETHDTHRTALLTTNSDQPRTDPFVALHAHILHPYTLFPAREHASPTAPPAAPPPPPPPSLRRRREEANVRGSGVCNYAPCPCNHGSVLSTRVRVSPGAMGLGPGRTSRPRVPYDEPRPARRSRAQRASVDGRGTTPVLVSCGEARRFLAIA